MCVLKWQEVRIIYGPETFFPSGCTFTGPDDVETLRRSDALEASLWLFSLKFAHS